MKERPPIEGDLGKTSRRELVELFKIWGLYPAPTGGEEKRQSFIERLAEKFGWESRRDEAGNISIRIPAAEGFKDAPLTVLHGHIDMVTEGGNDQNRTRSTIDEQQWMRALDETTLGADNGAGAVSILQLLLDIKQGRIKQHGEIVALFTVGEEAQEPVRQPNGEYVSKGGLWGARNLDAERHFGDLDLSNKDVLLINTDSEDGLGIITNGSAAGASMLIEMNTPEQHEDISADDELIEINVEGFLGGHSGTDIGEGRGNAIVALGWTLRVLQKMGVNARIVDVSGGTKPNAIPRYARCILAIPRDQINQAEEILKRLASGESQTWLNVLKKSGHEQGQGNPHLTEPRRRTRNEVAQATKLNEQATNDLIHLLTKIPTGQVTDGTSNNIGPVRMDNDGRVLINAMPRAREGSTEEDSSREVEPGTLDEVMARVRAALANSTRGVGSLVYVARYGHWEEPATEDSNTAEAVLSKAVIAVTGNKPKPEPTLGGLEVAILREALQRMGARSVSAISGGPEIKDPHSPDERMNVLSWEQFDDALRIALLLIAQPDADIEDLIAAARQSTARRSRQV